jgi:hypothetical protein
MTEAMRLFELLFAGTVTEAREMARRMLNVVLPTLAEHVPRPIGQHPGNCA